MPGWKDKNAAFKRELGKKNYYEKIWKFAKEADIHLDYVENIVFSNSRSSVLELELLAADDFEDALRIEEDIKATSSPGRIDHDFIDECKVSVAQRVLENFKLKDLKLDEELHLEEFSKRSLRSWETMIECLKKRPEHSVFAEKMRAKFIKKLSGKIRSRVKRMAVLETANALRAEGERYDPFGLKKMERGLWVEKISRAIRRAATIPELADCSHIRNPNFFKHPQLLRILRAKEDKLIDALIAQKDSDPKELLSALAVRKRDKRYGEIIRRFQKSFESIEKGEKKDDLFLHMDLLKLVQSINNCERLPFAKAVLASCERLLRHEHAEADTFEKKRLLYEEFKKHEYRRNCSLPVLFRIFAVAKTKAQVIFVMKEASAGYKDIFPAHDFINLMHASQRKLAEMYLTDQA